MFTTSAIVFITCRNRQHMRNNVRYKGNINNTFIFLIDTLVIYFSIPFYLLRRLLNKTPSDGTLLERTSRRFLWCWLVLLFFLTVDFHVSGLLFLVTGTPPWLLRPMKASTSSELYPGYYRFLYFFQVFSSHIYHESYSFEWAFFNHRRFFTLHSFPLFLGRFGTQMPSGIPHPGSSSVSALTELFLPADAWT